MLTSAWLLVVSAGVQRKFGLSLDSASLEAARSALKPATPLFTRLTAAVGAVSADEKRSLADALSSSTDSAVLSLQPLCCGLNLPPAPALSEAEQVLSQRLKTLRSQQRCFLRSSLVSVLVLMCFLLC
jgi:hypothetical protein